jgi:phage-related baseplate assembly protein
MNSYNAIDLNLLTPPDVVETIDYETILAAMIADLQSRDESFTALLESDPAYKILEVAAYREVNLRQRVNDAARAVMIAYATKTDLDNLGALFNVERLIVTPADNSQTPPVAAVYESDANFRRRILLAMEKISTAGASGSYIYHALSVSAVVKDAAVASPSPGEVVVAVLSADGNGVPDSDLLAAVAAAVNAENVRPLTDHVTVQGATLVEYSITAVLTLKSGASSELVRAAAALAVAEYAAAQHRLGATVALSGIYAALHEQSGVVKVALSSPETDIEASSFAAPYCTAITVTVEA